MRFKKNIEALKDLVILTGTDGIWIEKDGGHWQFKAETGAVLNWWSSTGTLQCQGPKSEKEALETALTSVMEAPALGAAGPPKVRGTEKKAHIFVVHGHDDVAREQLERILLLLGLNPYVLMNTSGAGKTIIEALEEQIGKKPEAEFGIVLMTPDDVGYSRKAGPEKAEPRARQNVILEMGMLMSSLGRARVAILIKGHIELPSDAQGVIYLHFNDHVKETVPKLVERLRLAGFELDQTAISRAAS